MKNIYVFLLLCCLGIVVSVDANAQTYRITGHQEQDSCGGGINYTFTINTANSGLTALTRFGDGTSAPGFLSGTFYSNSHHFDLPGIYTTKHILYLAGTPVDSLTFTDTIMCKSAFIAIYHDANGNCQRDLTEPFLQTPLEVDIETGGSSVGTVTVVGGGYQELTSGTSYSLKLLNLPTGLSVSCPSTGVITKTIAQSTPTLFAFGLQCNSSLSFDIAQNAGVRLGRHTEVIDIIVTNNQCTPQTATLAAFLSPKYGDFQVAKPAPSSRNGTVLTWTLPNISAFSSQHIYVHYEVSGTWLVPGDTAHNRFYLSPTVGDANTANNAVVRVDTVRSSFDPNAKTVYPPGDIAAGTQLEYIIEFENKGNAAAENIHILDTLSGQLDLSSIKVMSSTAPITNTSLRHSYGHNILRFDMPGIKLADSSQYPLNTGMVVFTVKAKNNLAQGTVIRNRAGIYFDDNEVVLTNYVQNKIPISNAGIPGLSEKAVHTYPNPVHDVLRIDAEGSFHTAQLINTLGQVVLDEPSNGTGSIDVHRLSAGIYYLVLKGEQGTITKKIQKL